MNTPILLIFFNRPDFSKLLIERLSKIKPKKIFISVDGARDNINGESEKCEKVRGLASNITWDCTVETLFHKENLGCQKAVVSAIDWFFSKVDNGIILEDDCIPSDSFFPYCSELLERYKDDSRIMHVAGTNLHLGRKFSENSYFFSNVTPVWGWATWKRAWGKYDRNLESFQDFFKNKDQYNIYGRRELQEKLLKYLKLILDGKLNTWDYQWEYSVRVNSGLSIYPEVNMIENIGFSAGASTHTNFTDKRIVNNVAKKMSFPLVHPKIISANILADKSFFNEFTSDRFKYRLIRKMKKILRKV